MGVMFRIEVRLPIARMPAATKVAPTVTFSSVFRNVASPRCRCAKPAGKSQKTYGIAATAEDRRRGATTGKRMARWITAAGRSVSDTTPSRARSEATPWTPGSSGRTRSS
ncbi:MAG: hypothetical protein DCC71_00160 [Proteobacteria bacterium]|nr:MAG: hypothetical protein DCC71_00160 [Pseudomonadota bacterium]